MDLLLQIDFVQIARVILCAKVTLSDGVLLLLLFEKTAPPCLSVI